MAKPTESVIDTLDRLPATLRTVRELRGLTLAEAAQRIGISASTLHNIENQVKDPGLAKVRACLVWLARP